MLIGIFFVKIPSCQGKYGNLHDIEGIKCFLRITIEFEFFCLECKSLFRSWDESIKLWNPNEDRGSLQTFREHRYCVYSATWSPQHAERFASASGDHTIKIWDVRGKLKFRNCCF